MKTTKLYRYIGYNGTLTTPILLPNIDHLEVVKLVANDGKILTNGDKTVYSIVVLPEDKALWTEIPDMDTIK
jgi:hypothetical protein